MIWDVSPEMGTIFGITLRWYGLLFALGLLLGGWYLYRQFRRLQHTQNDFESLLIWLFVCMFLGSRLVHCLCYEPNYYLSHIVEIFLPITIYETGEWTFTGYQGLASHGGGLGIVLGLVGFCAVHKKDFWPLADTLAIATPLAGGFIRLGNLMNSEIVGAVSNVPWAFTFTAVDMQPRHPAQLYEAIFYFILFAILALLYKRHTNWPSGLFLGISVTAIFTFRLLIEFVKEEQPEIQQSLGALDMGQWLSIPFIVVGIVLIIWSLAKRNRGTMAQ